MNKYIMNKTKYFLFLIAISITLGSCRKDEKDDCGCSSETVNTIPETNNLQAKIAYKTKIDNGDDYLNNRYWITVSDLDNSIQIHHLIVCNHYVIPLNIKQKLKNQESVPVKFAGKLKEACDTPLSTVNITFQRIVLTKIEEL